MVFPYEDSLVVYFLTFLKSLHEILRTFTGYPIFCQQQPPENPLGLNTFNIGPLIQANHMLISFDASPGQGDMVAITFMAPLPIC